MEDVVRSMFRADEEADREETARQEDESVVKETEKDTDKDTVANQSARISSGIEGSSYPKLQTDAEAASRDGKTDQADVPRVEARNGPPSLGKDRRDRVNDAYSQSVADLQGLATFYYNRGHKDRAQEICKILIEMRNQREREIQADESA